jgi:MFS family permease
MEKPLWIVCISHMFVEVYLLMHVALFPVYIREFQLSLVEVSLVAIVPNLIQLLVNIPSGFLTDRFSSRYILSASMIIEGASALVLSQTRSFWALVFAVSVNRLSSPLYHVAGLSQISRVATQEKVNWSIGVHNALGSLGAAIGLVSVTVALSTAGWRWAYLFWAIPILAWGFIILVSLPVQRQHFEEEKIERQSRHLGLSSVLSRDYLTFLGAFNLELVGTATISTFMTMYLVTLMGLSEATASLIYGLGPFMGILGSLGGGYLGDRMDAKKALSLFLLGCTISLFAVAFSSHLYLLVIVYMIYVFLSYSMWAPLNTIVADISPTTDRGLSYSVYFFVEGIVSSMAPAVAVAVIELSSIWFIMPFSMIFLLGGLIMFQFLSYPKKRPWTRSLFSPSSL